MAGSIRQRKDRGGDTWELRVYLGRDDRGRPKQRSILFRGGKRAAERELARLVAEQESSPATVPHDEARAWGSSTTINEAIELGKRFGGTDGHKYVNGVLDRLAAVVRASEVAAPRVARPRRSEGPASAPRKKASE